MRVGVNWSFITVVIVVVVVIRFVNINHHLEIIRGIAERRDYFGSDNLFSETCFEVLYLKCGKDIQMVFSDFRTRDSRSLDILRFVRETGYEASR